MRIYFGPDRPVAMDYSIVSLIHYLGYSVARSPEEPFDCGYLWSDSTLVEVPPELHRISREKPVLNFDCRDISKRNVERIAATIYGYGSLVDPCIHEGRCVKKHNDNGKREGLVVDCPMTRRDPDPGFVYQRFIETNPGGPQLEYRVPIVLGSVPIVFEVYKDAPESLPQRHLKHQLLRTIVPQEVSQIFGAAELEQLLRFSSAMGFDMGELDVLRCAESGRLYILDANTTPTYFSMFNRYWKPADKRKAIAAVAEKWEERLAARIGEYPQSS